jgi:SAM-dependent methyltransferase
MEYSCDGRTVRTTSMKFLDNRKVEIMRLSNFVKSHLPPRMVSSLIKSLRILKYVRINQLARKLHRMETAWVCALPWDPKGSVEYINEVYADYFTYSRLSKSWIKGIRVLEIGPGENLGVAVRFLADGASFVASVDRFESLRGSADQAEVYRQLIATLDDDQRNSLGDAMIATLSEGHLGDAARYRYFVNTGVEELRTGRFRQYFDLVISRAVLEHVADVEAAFESMHSLLRRGGYMIHEIDFRDHAMFGGLNPLTYLTISEWLWNAMTSHIGAPNRKLTSDFVRMFRQKKYEDLNVKIILIVGSDRKIYKEEIEFGVDYEQDTLDLIHEIRPHLAAEFRHRTDEELMVAAAFFTARRPHAR